MISDADPTILYQAHLPSKAWPLGHVRRFEHPSRLVHVGDDAIVIDTLGVRKGWHAFGRYYGFLDRWLSVFVTFDINDLSLTSYPKSEFPFAFNCDMTTPHYLHRDAIYTTDLHLDVLVLADGRSCRLVDLQEFEQAYAREVFGHAWYDGAKREADRVIREVERGLFIDMLQEVAPFPHTPIVAEHSTLRELGLDEVEFRYHPAYPRFR